MAVNKIVETPFTRRAVASTAVPTLDPFLKEDIPCLREVQLRCPEDADGNLVLNLNTFWRSRDLFRAWPDNVIGVTFLQARLAEQIAEKSGRKVRVGSYADYSASLHIYGQVFSQVGGDEEKGLKSFFENFDEETFVARSMTSDVACEMLVLPQLQELLMEVDQWRFQDESIKLLEGLIGDLESEKYTP
jgi:thymidylate synthase